MDTTFDNLDLSYTELVEDICIHIIDKYGKTVYYSKGCEKIEGYKKEDIVGKHIGETYWSEDHENFNHESSMHLKVLTTKQAIKNIPMTYYAYNNKLVQVVSSTYPITKDGNFVGAMCLFKDIAELTNMHVMIETMRRMIHRDNTLKLKNGTSYTFKDIVGRNKLLLDSIELAKKLAIGSLPILIIGETGTGKELFAQSIHNYSQFASGPFVAINCSALPDTLIDSILFGTSKGSFTGAFEKKGLFEEAQDGTLFLDEIHSMSLSMQSKLLRVLEEKKIRRVGGSAEITINCRILSATNFSSSDLLHNKAFRTDLFYRLAAASIEIPPLKNRSDDIDLLVECFINDNNLLMKRNVLRISSNCLDALKKHSWPGNIRELKHVVDYSFNLIKYNEQIISFDHLPPHIIDLINLKNNNEFLMSYEQSDLKNTLNDVERNIIIQSIKEFNGNLSKAAKSLGISRQNLHYRMKLLKITHE